MKKIWKAVLVGFFGEKTPGHVLAPPIPKKKPDQTEVMEGLESVTRYFGNQKDSLFVPEFVAATEINLVLQRNEILSRADAEEALQILNKMNDVEHYDGSGWYDYKIRLNYYIRMHGFETEWNHNNILLKETVSKTD
ncbi:hypothetical protein HHL16_05055 [Pseudoflavitalea sp. G-6-1-2]|uniref:hypothetical protein n=1 Tax=Pseudoflavitalea sp. G-6-1-2 TaxID=2728841 RepID=UPI00146D4380|nr:hypothetical protein [Pseudoflavitalea sp. G-6-1-2]NML20228.1 hypothetical protein [Pseudoflavitalea sp. G-6-1-2]